MRLACDTGGTFTDLFVEEDDGRVHMFKAPTVPTDPVKGLLSATERAAEGLGMSHRAFLGRCTLLIHGTTHAINAIITARTAKTAFLTTEGHPEILVLREGGRAEPFNFRVPYPQPYIPRALTFEIPERIDAAGHVVLALDEDRTIVILDEVRRSGAEAIAVCLLWAIVNPEHELRLGRLIERHLPGIPYTLAHVLNPTLREYRRASAAAIDASLKPLMQRYLGGLTSRLADAGFEGRTLVLTSQGGIMEAGVLAQQPIHAINSGPSMAPIAGRHYAALDGKEEAIIVADTGGTTYDVSLVRKGRIPRSRDTWIGQPFRGHMTGFPSIDIRSVGAGGGSIAWVDQGGLLHVGPMSAGANPGPACYNAGGVQPTLTDACLVLGYVDPEFFLGGSIVLDARAAERAIATLVAEPLGLDVTRAAHAILSVATENMVQAIAEITINQGIDPADAVLVGGGGAAGFNSLWIARRLNCERLIFPETGAALSAAGALMSDLRDEHREMFFTTSEQWDAAGVDAVLERLRQRCLGFARAFGAEEQARVEFAVEARYAGQVWELEIPLRRGSLAEEGDRRQLIEDFHDHHQEVFAVRDPTSMIEFVGWSATISIPVSGEGPIRLAQSGDGGKRTRRRRACFDGAEFIDTPVHDLGALPFDTVLRGPMIVETPFTTIVLDHLASCIRSRSGNLVVQPRVLS